MMNEKESDKVYVVTRENFGNLTNQSEKSLKFFSRFYSHPVS